MKQLIEDYKRRLKTVEEMLSNFNNCGSMNDIRKDERLKTKAAEYRTFIAEMERAAQEEILDSTEDSVFEWDLPNDLVPEVKSQAQPRIWTVPVCRTGFGSRTIEVVAATEEEAIEKAIDEAGNHEFSENDAEYSAPDGAF